MNVSQATLADLPDLLELVAEYQELDDSITVIDDGHNEAFLTEILSNERLGCLFIGRTSSKQPVGFVSVFLSPNMMRGEQIPEVRDLFVTASMRRKGFGRQLFDHALRWVKGKKHRRVMWFIENINVTAQYLFDPYETDTAGWVAYSMFLDKK